jgi:tetratricopeptide (TPR) repeat protein
MLKRIVETLPLLFSIVALALAGIAYYNEANRDYERTLVVNPPNAPSSVTGPGQQNITLDADQLANLLTDIQTIQRDTERASSSAETILGFIESGFTLLGAAIAIAAIAFGLSIQDVRSRLTDTIATADSRFDANEKRLEEVVVKITQEVQDSIQTGQERIRQSVDHVTGLAKGFENSIKDTESTVVGLHQLVNDAVQSAKADAENSFRVLSLLLLAEQQVRARNRTTAIATLQEAYGIDPTNQTTNYLLGYLYVGRKDFDLAVQHLYQALATSPDFAPALAAMGLAQRRMGDSKPEGMERNNYWAQAEANLTKALTSDNGLIDADNESYFGTLGGLYRRQKRYEDALKAYENSVKITPNNSYPVNNLAMLYKKLGYEEEAQSTFKRAIEIARAVIDDRPGDTWARLDLAQALLVTGDKKRALDEYKNAIGRIVESSHLEIALGGLEFMADAPQPIPSLEEAVTLLQNGIKHLQEHPHTLNH